MSSSAASLEERLRRRFARDSALRRGLRRVSRARKGLRQLYRHVWAGLLYLLVPGAVMADRRYFRLWERKGFHALRTHFYSPVPELGSLPRELFERLSESVGIEWNDRAQLELLATLRSEYREEYESLPREKTGRPYEFSLENSSFTSTDAEMLYALTRHLKPTRFTEIGSGHSTLLAAQALRVNQEKDGRPCELVAIEPFPDRSLRAGLPGLTRLVARPVQEVPLSEFETLGAGDILFIDSSHVLKTGSDVQFEYLEILPRLAPGVVVHIHDIYLPAEYPASWVLENQMFFNEQYLLQAFLSFNREFEVVWAGHYMHLEHPDELRESFSNYDPDNGRSGGSFWLRRTS